MCVFAVSSGLIIHHAALYSVTGGKERRKQLCMHSAHREEKSAHKNASNQTKGRKRRWKARSFILIFSSWFLTSHSYRITVFTQGVDLPSKLRCTLWTSAFFCNFMHNQKRFFYRFLFEVLVLQFQIRIFGGKTPFLVVTYSVKGICSEKDKIPVIVPVGWAGWLNQHGTSNWQEH